MTITETLLGITRKCNENIEELNGTHAIEKLSPCIAFSDDLQLWLSKCDGISDFSLIKEAQSECTISYFMCAQGFYKEAIIALRQFLEHFLFSIKLSTDDYKKRLWQLGQYDMSWTQLMDEQNGVFGKQFICAYANDISADRSIELLTICKDVYRECSEYVHGNYEKLAKLSNNLIYSEDAVECYVNYFESVQYIVSMALLIRYRDQLNDQNTLRELEQVLTDNLGTLPEVQALFE